MQKRFCKVFKLTRITKETKLDDKTSVDKLGQQLEGGRGEGRDKEHRKQEKEKKIRIKNNVFK